jgi:hypothetical protein
MTVDDQWTSATTDAVNAWKEDLGWDQDGQVTAVEVQFAAGQVHVSNIKMMTGRRVSANAAVYTGTDSGRQVTVPLPASSAAIAHVKDKVTVRLPTGSTVTGRISAVGATASPSGAGSGSTTGTANATSSSAATSEATIEVTIDIDRGQRVGSLNTAPVTAVFTQQRARNVLAVPVTALLMLAGGGYAVEVDDGGGRTHLIAVKPGLYSADGQVQITGNGVTEGTRVIVPRTS